MKIFAHRGASGQYPENTLLAISQALVQQPDGIEIDVHEAHGQLWVIHDHWLERTTNGSGQLHQHNIRALRQLDAGNGQTIPYLEEVLALINGSVTLNIEMKSGQWITLLGQLLDTLVDNGYPIEKLMISSFDHVSLEQFKNQYPRYEIAALIAHIPLDLAYCAERLNAVSLNCAFDSISPALIQDAHTRGLEIFVYTVDHPTQLHLLLEMGVDGVFSNYPNQARQHLLNKPKANSQQP